MGYALPRQLPGGVLSARAWDVVDSERVALGETFTIATSKANEAPPTAGAAPPNIDLLVNWTQPAVTTGIAWSLGAGSPIATISARGTYLIVLQIRYAAVGPIGLPGSTVGLRYARILLNGTDHSAHTIGQCPPKPGSVTGAGTTCVALAARPLKPGDVIYSGFRHTANGAITSLNTDYGGTKLSITRLGPGVEQ